MNLINIIAVIGILGVIFLLFKFKKLETLALLAALRAEALIMLSGTKKLEWAVDWLYSQKLFKDSFLNLIPKNFTKWVVNMIFNKNKANIVKEYKIK